MASSKGSCNLAALTCTSSEANRQNQGRLAAKVKAWAAAGTAAWTLRPAREKSCLPPIACAPAHNARAQQGRGSCQAKAVMVGGFSLSAGFWNACWSIEMALARANAYNSRGGNVHRLRKKSETEDGFGLRKRGGPWRKDLWLAKGLRDETCAKIGLNTNDRGSWLKHTQAQPSHPRDVFDAQVASPKSVQFLPAGNKAYVQALEGQATLVYNTNTLTRTRVIVHRFGAKHTPLFLPNKRYAQRLLNAQAPQPVQHFTGKPVEGTFSHKGRYLWVSLYRRSYDPLSQMPSALSVIDTQTERIVRVVNTGSIPKFLTLSPDQQKLAVIHWGENTVGVLGFEGDLPPPSLQPANASVRPLQVQHLAEWVVGKRLALDFTQKVNRDQQCGLCLRGATFTRDGAHLLVGRMGGGGISVLNTQTGRHVGVVGGSKPSPRHLVLSRDGKSVYVSANVSGWVEKFEVAAVLKAAYSQGGGQNAPKSIKPSRQVRLGSGVRTIALHPHKNLLLAVVNRRLMVIITGDVCAKDGSLLDFAFARARKNQPRAETPDAVAALWGEAVWKARWRGEIDGGMRLA